VVQLEDDQAVERVREWLLDVHPAVLNVAGPREEKRPGVQEQATELLVSVLREGME